MVHEDGPGGYGEALKDCTSGWAVGSPKLTGIGW